MLMHNLSNFEKADVSEKSTDRISQSYIDSVRLSNA